jgi:hypothetical protein
MTPLLAQLQQDFKNSGLDPNTASEDDRPFNLTDLSNVERDDRIDLDKL